MNQNKSIKTQKYFDELNKVIEKVGSRKELAHVLGVKRSTVGNWFLHHEKYIPSPENAYKMQQLYLADQDILRGKNGHKIN